MTRPRFFSIGMIVVSCLLAAAVFCPALYPQEAAGTAAGDTKNTPVVKTGEETPNNPGENAALKNTEVPALPDTDSISFLKSMMALSFVLGLIFLGAYFFKKFTGAGGSGLRTNRVPIHMVGNLPLGDKKFLSVVEIQEKHYFIGITSNSINFLSELDLDLSLEKAADTHESKNFENIFKKAKLLLQQGIRK
ncbi:MAG: FliO/MopB family protein [bacterium]|nr:FliO/MopB family protein [bacterium]